MECVVDGDGAVVVVVITEYGPAEGSLVVAPETAGVTRKVDVFDRAVALETQIGGPARAPGVVDERPHVHVAVAIIRPPGFDAEELVGVGESPVAVDQHHGVDALAAPHLLLRGRNVVQVELACIDDRHREVFGRVVGGVAAVVELHQFAVQQRLVVELVGEIPQRREGDARRCAVAVIERHFVHTLHEENPFAGLFETVDSRKTVIGPRARLHRRKHDALERCSVPPVAVAFGIVAVGVVHLGHN